MIAYRMSQLDSSGIRKVFDLAQKMQNPVNLIGFAGVAGLALVKSGGATMGGPTLAVLACLLAPLLYGLSGSFTKRWLSAAPSLVVATGSQLFAALALALPAALTWPRQSPAAASWLAVVALAVLCSAWGYILYFRLIARTGPANAMTVTYLVPAFAVAWGSIFLDEAVTPSMVLGCAVILTGTALATGLLPRRRTKVSGSPGR